MLTQYLPARDVPDQVRAFLAAELSAASAGEEAGAVVEEFFAPSMSAWAALADGQVRAVVAARLRRVRVHDPEYTYMPERYALVPMSLWYEDEGSAFLGDLLDHVARDARGAGIERVFIEVPVSHDAAVAAVMRAGYAPSVVLAASPTRPGAFRDVPGVRIRTALPGDREALIDLTLAEADYHAAHTDSGIRPGQERGPTANMVDEWLEEGTLPTFVAESDARVVGMMPLRYVDDGDGAALSRAYAYVASTFVDAPVRGRGVGSALLEQAFEAAHSAGVAVLLLHYVADNPLAASFWQAKGFSPVAVTFQARLGGGGRHG